MPEKIQPMEKLVFGEIEGKNLAIHAYDGIIWKIRAGFLSLFFGAWAILLEGVITTFQQTPEQYISLASGLTLFSIGFALGASVVDRNYVQRKFRVILALDALTDELIMHGSDYLAISPALLKVSGDNGSMPFNSEGYRQAVKVSVVIYAVPLLIVFIGVFFIFP